MLQALSLATLDGIHHGFFTRSGGVSEGVYTSLNGGVGSNDAPDKVAENRARMATALGVPRDRLLSVYQIHSPEVVVVEKPWAPDQRPGLLHHHDFGRMDLIDAEQTIARHAERRRHARAIFGDLVGRVVGADAAIEAGVDAFRHAAAAGEEAVMNAVEGGERESLKHGGSMSSIRLAGKSIMRAGSGFKPRRSSQFGRSEGHGLEQRAHAGPVQGHSLC